MSTLPAPDVSGNPLAPKSPSCSSCGTTESLLGFVGGKLLCLPCGRRGGCQAAARLGPGTVAVMDKMIGLGW